MRDEVIIDLKSLRLTTIGLEEAKSFRLKWRRFGQLHDHGTFVAELARVLALSR